jgi:hypothetical protein
MNVLDTEIKHQRLGMLININITTLTLRYCEETAL